MSQQTFLYTILLEPPFYLHELSIYGLANDYIHFFKTK